MEKPPGYSQTVGRKYLKLDKFYPLIQLFAIFPITFPMVKAARTVPNPRPRIPPANTQVTRAVTVRQVTSKQIFTLEYGFSVKAENSLGNRSWAPGASGSCFRWRFHAEQEIADGKIQNSPGQIHRQNIDPGLVDVHGDPEQKATTKLNR